MDQLYDLEAISSRLGVSVPALKRRVTLLKLEPTERGSRGKLLFDDRGVALLESADALMKDGDGMTTVRRKLGITLTPEDLTAELEEEREPVANQSAYSSQAAPQREFLAAIESLTAAVQKANETVAERDQQLIQTMNELRRVAETAAAMGERNSNLTHQVQQLQGQVAELKLLAAPPASTPEPKRPWWRIFGDR